MAKNKASIFQPDVGGINDPVAVGSPDYTRASAAQAQDKLALAQTQAKVGESLGQTAIEAYKGKLLADAEGKIKNTLDRLDGYGETAKDAQANLAHLESNEFAANSAIQIEQLNQQTAGFDNDPTVKDFLTTIQKYKAAESQRILSKQDALNRIASTVKQYSAMMPGWASDFRKSAASLTGIDAVDTYAIHAALTGQSANEKAQQKMLEAGIKYEADVAEWAGVAPGTTTPQMKQQYAQEKQLGNYTTSLENKAKIAKQTDEERNVIYGQIVGAEQMKQVGRIVNAMNAFREANSGVDISSQAAYQKIGSQTLGLLNDIETGLTQDIMGMTQRSPNNPYPMKWEQAQKHIEQTKAFLKTYKDNLTNEQGWNAFTMSVKAAEGNYERMMNNMLVANPHIAQLIRGNALPDVLKSYLLVNGDQKKLTSQWGEVTANAIIKFMHSGDIGAGVLASSHEIPDASACANLIGAEATKCVWLDANMTIDRAAAATEPLGDQDKNHVVNKLTTYANWFSPTDQKAMDDFSKKVTSNTFVKAMEQLSPAQQQQATLPFYKKALTSAHQILPILEQRAREAGAEIEFNPATNQFVAVYPRGQTAGETLFGSNRGELERQIRNINSVSLLMEQLAPMAGDKVTGAQIPKNMAEAYEGILETRMAGLQERKATIEAGKATGEGMVGSDVTMNSDLATDSSNKEIDAVNAQIRATQKAQSKFLGTDKKKTVRPVDTLSDAGASDAIVKASPENTGMTVKELTDTRKYFTGLENEYELPPGLLDRVWAAESGRGKNMKSSAGAEGHFQFMPATAKEEGLLNPNDVKESAKAAASYLSKQMKRFGGDVNKALAAYNWGPSNVEKRGLERAPKETRDYVAKITKGLEGGSTVNKALAIDEGINTLMGKEVDLQGIAARKELQNQLLDLLGLMSKEERDEYYDKRS